MALRGEVSLSKRDITKRMGMIMRQRMEINLTHDLIDETPDFFWESGNDEVDGQPVSCCSRFFHIKDFDACVPQLEDWYLKCRSYLKIDRRLDVLNARMDLLKEMFGLLHDELDV